MLIVLADASGELTVKNSRFLSEITRVNSPDEAREIWHSKKETYDNGGHIVYAFITGPQGNIMGCSDDGEPSGTAGRPTLTVLKGAGATNILLTTARWFGGTKLGTGGLVKAYTESAQLALANCRFTELVEEREMIFSVPYALYEQCRRAAAGFDFKTADEIFSDTVMIRGTIRESDREKLQKILTDLSNGQIKFNGKK